MIPSLHEILTLIHAIITLIHALLTLIHALRTLIHALLPLEGMIHCLDAVTSATVWKMGLSRTGYDVVTILLYDDEGL